MGKLLGLIVHAWCWLRVAASPTLIGIVLGAGLYYAIGGPVGTLVGGMVALLGLCFGVRLANHARREGQLVDYAHGLSPGRGSSNRGGEDAER